MGLNHQMEEGKDSLQAMRPTEGNQKGWIITTMAAAIIVIVGGMIITGSGSRMFTPKSYLSNAVIKTVSSQEAINEFDKSLFNMSEEIPQPANEEIKAQLKELYKGIGENVKVKTLGTEVTAVNGKNTDCFKVQLTTNKTTATEMITGTYELVGNKEDTAKAEKLTSYCETQSEPTVYTFYIDGKYLVKVKEG